MALTASAQAGIQAAIVESLHLVDPVLVLHQLDRPNIFLSVGKSVGLSVSDMCTSMRYLKI